MRRFLLLAPLLAILAAAVYAGDKEKDKAKDKDKGPDKIWSAVVFASNAAQPKELPVGMKQFGPKLKKTFGYNQFEVLGQASNEIGDREESWLVPTENFWFSVRARRAMSKEAQGGYLLSLQLFQDKRPLVDTELKIAPGSPFFIWGPQYGAGQLIIVLQVQR